MPITLYFTMNWIYSMRPDVALMVLDGEINILFSPIKITGKVAIHTTFYGDKEEQIKCDQIIRDMGYDPDYILEGSLMGWAKVKGCIVYDDNSFMTDFNKHRSITPNLQQFRRDNQWYGDVFGVYLENINIPALPIIWIGEYQEPGTWWQPGVPLDSIGCKILFAN
jgi:hypothetical protein